MLSSSEDKTICVWECKNWDCVKTLKGHRYSIQSFFKFSYHITKLIFTTPSMNNTVVLLLVVNVS